jgi:hypothetical protein
VPAVYTGDFSRAAYVQLLVTNVRPFNLNAVTSVTSNNGSYFAGAANVICMEL